MADDMTNATGALNKALGGLSDKVNKSTSEELEKMANDYADDARENVPVDTGTLQSTIRVVRDSPEKVVVLAGDEDTAAYAAHVEYGTSMQEPQPYMRQAAISAEGSLADRMGDALKQALGD